MGFKMLILLGFFTVEGGFFIHSDIHRSIVNRVDYSVQIAANRTVAQESRRLSCRGRCLCESPDWAIHPEIRQCRIEG
jgi:hypothetical protein